jgi:hypothetical protein
VVANADSVHFAGANTLLFRALEKQRNFLEQIQMDGTGRRRTLDRPIVDLQAVSPDGGHVVLALPAADRPVIETVVASVLGGPPRVICSEFCPTRWSPDGRYLYVETRQPSTTHPGPGAHTLIIPLASGRAVPDPAADPGEALETWETLPGVTRIERGYIDPGPDPSTYIFRKQEQISNLFRVPIR